MKVIIVGATGMVGRGVLRECLLASDVTQVLVVGRTKSGQSNPRLRELVQPDLFDCSPIESDLAGYDACFFCLGVSSSGMTQAAYTRLTYDLTVTIGQTLAKTNPNMAFVYVSGNGTDSSEQGRSMWARVKGRTENALLALPFKAVYLFRPGIILPMHGEQSKTNSYRVFYQASAWLLRPLRHTFPNLILTTEIVGRAMLAVVRGAPQRAVLESRDINARAAGR
jgi:uncharacterized protein YbjT (DUF2867 family)